jgi:hypothetical protein
MSIFYRRVLKTGRQAYSRPSWGTRGCGIMPSGKTSLTRNFSVFPASSRRRRRRRWPARPPWLGSRRRWSPSSRRTSGSEGALERSRRRDPDRYMYLSVGCPFSLSTPTESTEQVLQRSWRAGAVEEEGTGGLRGGRWHFQPGRPIRARRSRRTRTKARRHQPPRTEPTPLDGTMMVAKVCIYSKSRVHARRGAGGAKIP